MKRELLHLNNRYQPSNLIHSPDSCSPGELPLAADCRQSEAADVGQELHLNNYTVMGKTMKRDRKTSGERDAPQKYTSKWRRGRKEEKAPSMPVFSLMLIIYVVCAFFIIIIYLFPSFSAACLWNFPKGVPSLSLSLCFIFTFVSSMRSKADMHCWPLQNL